MISIDYEFVTVFKGFGVNEPGNIKLGSKTGGTAAKQAELMAKHRAEVADDKKKQKQKKSGKGDAHKDPHPETPKAKKPRKEAASSSKEPMASDPPSLYPHYAEIIRTLPEKAWPTKKGRGKHSYTLEFDTGAKVEVLLRNSAFRITLLDGGAVYDGKKQKSWGGNTR